MIEITHEFVEDLVNKTDEEQFKIIDQLSREELQDVVARLLGMMQCKIDIIKIVERANYEIVGEKKRKNM